MAKSYDIVRSRNYGEGYGAFRDTYKQTMDAFDKLPKEVRQKLTVLNISFDPIDTLMEWNKGRTIKFMLDGLHDADVRAHQKLAAVGKAAPVHPDETGWLNFNITPTIVGRLNVAKKMQRFHKRWERIEKRLFGPVAFRNKLRDQESDQQEGGDE